MATEAEVMSPPAGNPTHEPVTTEDFEHCFIHASCALLLLSNIYIYYIIYCTCEHRQASLFGGSLEIMFLCILEGDVLEDLLDFC